MSDAMTCGKVDIIQSGRRVHVYTLTTMLLCYFFFSIFAAITHHMLLSGVVVSNYLLEDSGCIRVFAWRVY